MRFRRYPGAVRCPVLGRSAKLIPRPPSAPPAGPCFRRSGEEGVMAEFVRAGGGPDRVRLHSAGVDMSDDAAGVVCCDGCGAPLMRIAADKFLLEHRRGCPGELVLHADGDATISGGGYARGGSPAGEES